MSEVTRRSALWLLAAGAGTTLMAGEVPGEREETWSVQVEIEGAPVTAANVHSVEFAPVEFSDANGKGKRNDTGARVVLHAATAAGVRKELDAWFVDARSRRIKVTAKSDGGVRTFNLIDCFPTRFNVVAVTAGGATSFESIEVKVSRVELA